MANFEADGFNRPNDKNEPKGFMDDFLQHHASANRKSFASWYNSEYLPANKNQISRQANLEMEKMLKPCTGQHELTRSELQPENLAIVSEWETVPLTPGTAEFQHARIRLIKNMAAQGMLDGETISTLNIAPAELNQARIWLYESTQGEIVEHYPYRLPFFYKELEMDGQTTLPPWPYPQRIIRHVIIHTRDPEPLGAPQHTVVYVAELDLLVMLISTPTPPVELLLTVNNDADGITEAPPDDQTAITPAPSAIHPAITEPQTQQENGLAEERAVEGATTHAVPDPNGSSSGSRHGLRDSHVDTHGTAEHERAPPTVSAANSHVDTHATVEHEHAPPALSAAFAEVRNKPEGSDEETSDSDGGV